MDVKSFCQIYNDGWMENLSDQFNASIKLLKNTFWTNKIQLGTSCATRGLLDYIVCLITGQEWGSSYPVLTLEEAHALFNLVESLLTQGTFAMVIQTKGFFLYPVILEGKSKPY